MLDFLPVHRPAVSNFGPVITMLRKGQDDLDQKTTGRNILLAPFSRLHGSRFFGCPRQWAPEEALKDVNNYGTYTEIW
uniref:Uncharacterized protein n=1 Tax=Parascaris equorum TaxID=6256 RepID=A0A914R1P5_PAREQ